MKSSKKMNIKRPNSVICKKKWSIKSQIIYKEYKSTITERFDQQKEFEAERGILEEEYQKLRGEYIKREREIKKKMLKKEIW